MGPDKVETGMGIELSVTEQVGTDTGNELVGTDRVATEKEGAAGEDIFATERDGAEAVGRERVVPVGWGGGRELMEDRGSADGGTAVGETDE